MRHYVVKIITDLSVFRYLQTDYLGRGKPRGQWASDTLEWKNGSIMRLTTQLLMAKVKSYLALPPILRHSLAGT